MREAHTARSLGPALLALLIAGQAAAFVDRSLPAVMAPALKATLGLTDIQLGLLQGPAFVAFYVLAALGAGLLADHPARLRILAGCVLAWTAATLAFALAPDFRILVAGRLVVGPAQAIFSPLALSLMAEGAPPSSRGRRLALFTTSASVGRSLAFLAGGALLALLARGGAGKADAWRPRLRGHDGA